MIFDAIYRPLRVWVLHVAKYRVQCVRYGGSESVLRIRSLFARKYESRIRNLQYRYLQYIKNEQDKKCSF